MSRKMKRQEEKAHRPKRRKSKKEKNEKVGEIKGEKRKFNSSKRGKEN